MQQASVLVGFSLCPQPKGITSRGKSISRFGNSSRRNRVQAVESAMASVNVQELQRDIGVMVGVVAGAYAWVHVFDLLTGTNVLEQKLSRKLVHITTGPLFMLSWSLFSSSPWSRYVAAVVPMANAIRLLSIGLGFRQDEGVVKSVSRDGDPRELLRGPLYYVGVLLVSTVFFWRESPQGMLALSMMCGGDGMADIVGRKFGQAKLPYNDKKSWAGSCAMFLAGLLLSMASVYYFSSLGFYKMDLEGCVIKLALVSLAATVVESLPVTSALDDNLIVPTAVMILASILFQAS